MDPPLPAPDGSPSKYAVTSFGVRRWTATMRGKSRIQLVCRRQWGDDGDGHRGQEVRPGIADSRRCHRTTAGLGGWRYSLRRTASSPMSASVSEMAAMQQAYSATATELLT